jgi:hypothetical protein
MVRLKVSRLRSIGDPIRIGSGEAEIKHLQGTSSRTVKVVAQRMMLAKRDGDKLGKALSYRDMW